MKLEYDGTEKEIDVQCPKRVLLKFPEKMMGSSSSNEDASVSMKVVNSRFATECAFYVNISKDAGLPCPRCWFAAAQPEENRFVMMLDDSVLKLNEEGVFAGSTTTPISLSDAKLAVSKLAVLHAKFWGGRQNPTVVMKDEER